MKIDLQSHWYPPGFAEALSRRSGYPRTEAVDGGHVYYRAPHEQWSWPRRFTDLDLQMETMHDIGIDVVVSSPAVWGDLSVFDETEALELSALLNEELAAAQAAYPGRFLGLASLPMQSPERAVDVLDRAIGELGLRGVCLHANVGGEPIGAKRFWPVYARAAALGVPLVLHPAAGVFSELLVPDGLQVPLGFLFDTSSAAISLVVSGVFDEFPDLKVVHPHLGGVLPYVLGRIDGHRANAGKWPHLQRSVAEYLRLFWVDTAAKDVGAVAMARQVYGGEHMLFATDYPYVPPERGLRFVEQAVEEAQRPDVTAGNAMRLLDVKAPARGVTEAR